MKDIIILLLIVAAGFGLGKFGLQFFNDEEPPYLSKPLEELLGVKKTLSDEDKATYMRHQNEGYELRARGQLDKAAELAQKMITLNPWNVEGYLLYGNAGLEHFLTGSPSSDGPKHIKEVEVRKSMLLATRLEPDNVDVLKLQARYHAHLGSINRNRKEQKDAERHFGMARKAIDKAIKIDGHSKELRLSRVNLTLMEGKFDEALAVIDEMLKEDGNENMVPNLYDLQALSHIGKGDIKSAEKSYTAALNIPNLAPIGRMVLLRKRAGFYRANNFPEMARQDLLNMLKIQPNNAQIKRAIEQVEKEISGEKQEIKKEDKSESNDNKKQTPEGDT